MTTADRITRNLLQYCYTCDAAMDCVTEETCRECWAERGIDLKETEEFTETARFLTEYYA